jgi:ribosomal protein RSM22 (predicted rRNA methylase)
MHVIAPCPHEFECPLAGGRDRCSFSQKLQRPDFTRKTKHTNRGEEDVNYTYLVLGRGSRPTGESTQSGRVGGVGKEALEKEAGKREGKSELREVEGGGGEFEMVSLSDTSGHTPGTATEDGKTEEEVDGELRTEAYTWPRVVAPPMKRAGHVILDTCFPDGTFSSTPSLPKRDSAES